jgi:hypothetical protein
MTNLVFEFVIVSTREIKKPSVSFSVMTPFSLISKDLKPKEGERKLIIPGL